MIGNLCCLLVGLMLGGVLAWRWWVVILDRPGALGRFLAGALRGCAHACQRDWLHFLDADGAPVRLNVNEVCRTLENEIGYWQSEQPAPSLPPDGFA